MSKTKSLLSYRTLLEKEESRRLQIQAAHSQDHSRYFGSEGDYRLPYKRDVDRILHSKAYARYSDKTQVAYLISNDHITGRALHVQFVSGFARGIAEILKLNTSLVEAIALGHDVGHPPFGHEGERHLSALTEESGLGFFTHPNQSCRWLSVIEPLNLGLNVLDGFLCHDGGLKERVITPAFGKTWEQHFEEREAKGKDPALSLTPATLEGCLVKMCDTMSYVGRDIEDAIRLGILTPDQVPKTYLGSSNSEILSTLACDLIENSYDKGFIAISEKVLEALKLLRHFNFETIYFHPKLKGEAHKVKRAYHLLFTLLFEEWEDKGEESYLWTHFLYNKPKAYLDMTDRLRTVVDFISGMTDSYFIETLKLLAVPAKITLP